MGASNDVIIIGGGIIGLSIADRLAREGVGVTLLERGACGREASWASAGILKPSNPNKRGPMQQLQRVSLEMFPDFCTDLQNRTGIDPEYARCGWMELLMDDQRYRMALSEQRAGAEQGLLMPDGQPEWQVLTPEEAAQIEPAVSGDCLGVLLSRFSAQVRNSRLLRALIAACKAGGVQMRENTPVTSLQIDGNRVTGVVTGDKPVMGDRVVLCAGAWSSEIDARVRPLLPTYPVRGQIVLLDASDVAAARFTHVVERKGCYLVRRSDGLVLVGSTVEHESGFDRRTTPAGVHQLMEDTLTLIPGLADASVAAFWAGLRPGTPDRRPYIGPVPGFEGLIAATGHYRTGVALAPITAEVVADFVLRGTCQRDLSRCRPGRST
ncbi:MAG TPA: glycine oxidase ThiO [Phycisphaerae bacterium]|nr:glycine oxidase ThiO [Phycisphaerae bacterium]